MAKIYGTGRSELILLFTIIRRTLQLDIRAEFDPYKPAM